MKVRNLGQKALLPITLTILGVVGESCGNRATNSENLALLTTKIANSANANGASPVPKVSVQLDEIRKQLRDATEFWKLSLAEESKERKAADEAIRADVVALDERVSNLQQKLEAEIAELAEKQALLDKKVDTQGADLRALIDVERAERERADALIYEKMAEQRRDLEAQIDELKTEIVATKTELSDTKKELIGTLADDKKFLVGQIESLAASEAKSRDDLRSALTGQLNSSIDGVKASLELAQKQLKTDILATQASLEKTIEESEKAIKQAMDDNDADLAAKLKKEMDSQVQMQNLANKALQDEVERLELMTKKDGEEMKAALVEQMNNNMDTVGGWVSAARRSAQVELMTAVDEQSKALVRTIVQTSAKIAQLDAKVDNQNAELSSAIEREKEASLQREAAAAKRQEEFEALQKQINAAQEENNSELAAQLNAQKENLERLAAKQEADRLALEASIKATNERITQVRNELQSELNSRSEMLEKRIAMTRDELKNDLKKQANGTAAQLRNLRKDLNAAKYALQKNIAGVQAEMVRLNSELTKAVNESNDSLKAQLEAEIAARKTKEAALSAEIGSLREMTEKQDEELRAEFSQSLEKNMEQVAGWVENARNEAAAANRELMSQLNSLDQKVSLNQEELKKELQAQLSKSISAVRSELGTAKRALEMKMAKNNRNLKNLLAQKTAELESASAAAAESLKNEIQQLKFAQEAQNSDLASQIQTLELMTKADGDKLKAELEGKMSSNMGQVEAWIGEARAEAESNLISVVGDTEARLVNAMVAGDNAMREQMTAQINDVSEEQSKALLAFKQHVDATYAKRTELAQLANFVNGIKNAVSRLDAKVDDNDARLSAEIRKVRSDLKNDIRRVTASVNSLRTDFNGHVSTYQKKVTELAKESRNAASALKAELMAYKAMDADAQLKMEATIQNLANKITDTEAFATQTRDALAGKIVELEQKDSELSDDIRSARDEVTKNFNAALAIEQAERKAIADEVTKLQAEVQRVSQVANQALNLAKANDLAIAGVREDLAAAEGRWKSQLEGLRGEMKKDIDEVRGFAEGLVKGLGEQVQKQFTDVAATLADTKSKIAGLSSELGRLFEKPFASSTDPMLSGTANVDNRAKRISIFNEKVSINKSEDVGGTKRTVQELAAQRAGEFSSILSQIEAEFLLAIDYAETKFGENRPIDLVPFNNAFAKDVAGLKINNQSVCRDGYTGFKDNAPEGEYHGLMAGVGSKEWWAHLSRAYVSMLVSGSRSGNSEIDKIFHGVQPVADGMSLQSALAMAAIPSHASGESGECIARVSDWAKRELTGTSERSVKLRQLLADHNGLKQLLATRRVKSSYDALAVPAGKIESLAKETLKQAFGGDEGKTVAYMRSGDSSKSDPGFFVQAAQIIHESASLHDHEVALEANKDAIADVAREANKNNEAFKSKLAQLESKLAKFAKLDERVSNLEKSQAAAFGLIAAMATRLGFSDLVEKAKSEIGQLAVQPDPSLTLELGCKATSHFFNYANEGEALKRCDSGVSTVDGMLGDSGGCRSRQNNVTNINTNVHTTTHTHTSTTTNVNQTHYSHYYTLRYRNTRCGAYQWCDFYRSTYWVGLGSYWRTNVSSSSSSSTSTSTSVSTSTSKWVEMQEAFVGVLRTPWLSPMDSTAQSILRRAAGSPFPSDRKTMIGLRIFGNASKWKIEDPESGRNVTIEADDFKVSDTAKGLVYELPASMFLSKTDGRAGFTETARITALDAFGQPSAKTCNHSMNGGTYNTTRTSSSTSSSRTSSSSNRVQYNTNYVSVNHGHYVSWYTSPLVLDFSGTGKLATVEPRKSKAQFDIEGSGMRSRIGWIGPKSGLLALDQNGNGKIDSGRELFGNYTITRKGERAWNGYEALADHDSNKDGVIDRKDKVYSKLVVWFDSNGDGVTQKGELKKLSQLGVTGISVQYSSVPTLEQAQHKGKDSTNLVLYQSKFFGSMCPQTGCATFDVYFGYDTTVQPVALK